MSVVLQTGSAGHLGQFVSYVKHCRDCSIDSHFSHVWKCFTYRIVIRRMLHIFYTTMHNSTNPGRQWTVTHSCHKSGLNIRGRHFPKSQSKGYFIRVDDCGVNDVEAAAVDLSGICAGCSRHHGLLSRGAYDRYRRWWWIVWLQQPSSGWTVSGREHKCRCSLGIKPHRQQVGGSTGFCSCTVEVTEEAKLVNIGVVVDIDDEDDRADYADGWWRWRCWCPNVLTDRLNTIEENIYRLRDRMLNMLQTVSDIDNDLEEEAGHIVEEAEALVEIGKFPISLMKWWNVAGNVTDSVPTVPV